MTIYLVVESPQSSSSLPFRIQLDVEILDIMKRRNLEYTEKVIRSKGHSQQQTMITYGVDVGY